MDITNGRHKSFDAMYFTKISHVWQYFVYSRLMPITHYNTMDKERVIFLFGITSTKIIDVGVIVK